MKKHNEKEQSSCSFCEREQRLSLDKRQISLIVSGIMLLSFFVFITGYFLGKQKALEQFAHHIDQEAFSDKMYASLLALTNKSKAAKRDTQAQDIDVVVYEEDDQPNAAIAAVDVAYVSQQDTMQQAIGKEADIASYSPNDIINNDAASEMPNEQYYAQLIGFGTFKAAHQFTNRLLHKNISVSVRKRQSKTTKGKVITWYQVITDVFNNKDALIELVETVKKETTLHDIRIVSC